MPCKTWNILEVGGGVLHPQYFCFRVKHINWIQGFEFLGELAQKPASLQSYEANAAFPRLYVVHLSVNCCEHKQSFSAGSWHLTRFWMEILM